MVPDGEPPLQVATGSDAITVATFYAFCPISDADTARDAVRAHCASHGMKGTMIIAAEGLNATLAGPHDAVAGLIARLRGGLPGVPALHDFRVLTSQCDRIPFTELKVKVKPEIVTLRAGSLDPVAAGGIRVPAQDWNALISRPDVRLIDTRNDYEVQMGRFQGAEDPRTESFTAFKDYACDVLARDKSAPIAMYCTGGIRCEKASAWLRAEGFTEVYQLDGGILHYLRDVPESESLWEGACFVFDGRVGVRHGLRWSGHKLCYDCGWPILDDPNGPPGATRCGCPLA